MQTSALFGTKTSDFLKFMVRLHEQGGLSQCRQEGRGSIFRDFVQTFFNGQPLIEKY